MYKNTMELLEIPRNPKKFEDKLDHHIPDEKPGMGILLTWKEVIYESRPHKIFFQNSYSRKEGNET